MIYSGAFLRAGRCCVPRRRTEERARLLGRCVGARHIGHGVAQPVVLTGKEGGRPGSGPLPLQKHPQQVVPSCVSTVFGETLSEAEPPGLEGPLRKGATVQKQCGPASRVNGQRKGSPGSGLLQKYPQQFVPYCVSTVPDATLSEAEPPGLEGP